MEIDQSGYKIWSGDNVSDFGSLTLSDGNEMDILGVEGPNKGRLFQCIYKFENDGLLICYSLTGRPNDFEATKENNFILIKWVKK